jgi:hypothetical protein
MSKKKTILFATSIAALAFTGGILSAGPMRGHPNLEHARDHLNQAWEEINAAQQANEWDMNHHAEKAKELIGQAKEQLVKAAETANEHR